MTRGRVTHNRLDIALESHGSIFGGRDEKQIIEKRTDKFWIKNERKDIKVE